MIKNNIVYNHDWRLTIKRAEESFFWDQNGRKIIDFSSGWNVANLGWNHPDVAHAMIEQTKKNVYVPMEAGEEIQYEYAKALLNVLPKEFNMIGRSTGGTEANEQAIKLARASTGRKKILGIYDTYHGESLTDLAIGFRKKYIKKIAPLPSGFIHLQFPSTFLTHKSESETLDNFLTEFENLLKKKDVAAIITEAGIITGWGSTHVAPKGYLKSVRKLTQQYGTLLILDEVGTGFSRTGKLFGMEHENVVPDFVTFAKAISNGGAAMGAVVTKQEIAKQNHLDAILISTFGWTPVACAASLATLKVHMRDKMWEKSQETGNWFKKELINKLGTHPKVGDIRGIGMEIGLIFVSNQKSKKPDSAFAQEVSRIALKHNLYTISGDEGCIQLMPPLITQRKVLEEGIEIITQSIKEAYDN
jgi:4-aminobutyrate aminotransferase-like enzyme